MCVAPGVWARVGTDLFVRIGHDGLGIGSERRRPQAGGVHARLPLELQAVVQTGGGEWLRQEAGLAQKRRVLLRQLRLQP